MKGDQKYNPGLQANKVVVIAGESNKTGRAIAERVAETGANIIIADINLINAEIAVQAITDKYKTKAAAFSLPAGEKNGIASTLKAIAENRRVIDVWINASNLFHNRQLLEMEDRGLEKLMQKNTQELFTNTKQVADYMVATKVRGIIVNVISVRDFVLLNETKFHTKIDSYITACTNSLSDKLCEHGIKLFTIAPVWNQVKSADGFASAYALPDDIALLVLFCISTLSKSTTGKVLRLSGNRLSIDTK